MASEQTIHLGYEVGTGEPVAVPLRHMAVTGQTQQSGKTTTLEALIGRSGGTALTFVTKRGEGSFALGRRVEPYFRDRADWKFVDELLEAVLQEKNKFLRQWIIRICRTTETLADVQEEVREKLATAKGMDLGAFTQLDAYLEMIVPEIARADLADKLDLAPGLNVMDVSEFQTPMQMLFVQSALDWINAKCRKTTVVIPEAWEFVPQGKAPRQPHLARQPGHGWRRQDGSARLHRLADRRSARGERDQAEPVQHSRGQDPIFNDAAELIGRLRDGIAARGKVA